MKSKVYKRKFDTQHELLARISDAAARIKKRQNQLTRTKCDLHTRAANYIEVDGGNFEYLLWTVWQICHFSNFTCTNKIKIAFTVSNFFFPVSPSTMLLFSLIQTAVSWTTFWIRYIFICVFLTMTYTTDNTKNMDLFLWNTLYMCVN